MAEIKENHDDGRDRDCRENQTATQENAETVGEIADRLGQKGIDLAFADVRCNLPFIFCWRDQVRDDDRKQIIIDHRTIVVAVHPAAGFSKNRAPEKNGPREWNQSEDRTQEIIPPVNESVLQPEIENREVFFHGRVLSTMLDVGWTSSTARLIAAIMLSARAMPFPAIWKAVP